MKHQARPGSIARKLTAMNLLVSATALLLACAAFATYDWMTFRTNMVRNLSVQAQIIGANSTSALLFDDPQSAETTLSALRATPVIVAAKIYRPDGGLFAAYGDRTEDRAQPRLANKQLENYWFRGRQIVMERRIVSQGTTAGIVYLRSNLSEMYARLEKYVLIALAVMVMSLFAALLASWIARGAISGPIVRLAETARAVSRNHNYTIRADASAGSSESIQLIESFNEMLKQIQQRDASLHKASEELEERVKERTAALEIAHKEAESFSYSVSHDLRAPLRSIDGFSQVLLEDYANQLDETGGNYLQRIRAAAQRMSVLIDDLLNLSRVSRMELTRVSVDLTVLANAVREELQESDSQRHVEWVIEENLTATGDPRLLRLVMQNLLGNAWKYTSSHPEARIEFGRDHQNGRQAFFVRDDGAGFDPAYSAKLFGAFQRLHSPNEFPGTGIGLATVQRIIRRHGGEVWAEGLVEKGASFYFTL